MRVPQLTATLLITAALSASVGAQSQTGTIRVLVQTQGTSEPIAGAQVILTGQPVATVPAPPAGTNIATPFGGAFAASTPGFTATVLTDAAGIALFERVPLDRYTVRAQRDGYMQPSGAGANSAIATVAVAANSPSPMAVTLSLAPAGMISGRVRDAYGVPLPAARIYAATLGYRDGRPTLLPGPNAQPDGQGNYRLTSVMPGEYYIKVEPAALRGTGAFYPGVADLEKATLVPVQSGQEVVGVDFDMSNVPMFKVSGKMLNVPPPPPAANGLPSPNRILGLTFAPADPRNPDQANTPLVQNVSRGTNGEFEISLPAGDWAIFPVIPLNNPGAGTSFAPGQSLPTYATGRTRVLVSDQNIENVTITIGASDMKVRVTGAPAASTARVALVPRENIPSPLIGHLRSGQALSANGEVEFKSVPPGKYSVQITSLPPSFFIADVRVGSRSVYNDGIIAVDLDPIEPVEVLLNQGGGNVHGTIIVPTSLPASGPSYRTVLIPAPPRRENPSLYRNLGVFIARDSFDFLNVPAGDYKVFAFQSLSAGGAEQDEAFMSKYESLGTPVTVVDGQTSNVTVRWIPKD